MRVGMSTTHCGVAAEPQPRPGCRLLDEGLEWYIMLLLLNMAQREGLIFRRRKLAQTGLISGDVFLSVSNELNVVTRRAFVRGSLTWPR